MSDDIFADWKVNRFIIADSALHDFPGHLIVLSDVSFWANNADKLEEWCSKNGCSMQGMTVNIPDPKKLTLFILEWS